MPDVRLRLPGEAPEPRSCAAGGQVRAGALHPAAGERLAARRGTGIDGGTQRCPRAVDRRIGNGERTAGGAQSQCQPIKAQDLLNGGGVGSA